MKISRLLFLIPVIVTSMHLQAQIGNVIYKSDSIKSMVYNTYKAALENGKVVKGKSKILFEGYPILYPTSKLFFNKDGLLIKKDKPYQKDTTYYNSENQKIKMVLYPSEKNDSITFNYTYDSHGNIETIAKKASAPKMDFSLNGNYYSYTALIDEFYKNYYLTKDNQDVAIQFQAIKPEKHTTYRLYNDVNKLLEEIYLTTRNNSFPNKPDSTIHTITYKYNKENKIVKISNSNKNINAIGKNYTSTETEEHNYRNNGLIHQIKYFSNGKQYREELIAHNSEGILIEYTNHSLEWPRYKKKHVYNSNGELIRYTFTNPQKNKIIRNITLKYTYNDKGDWITCIHFDKNNKPQYLIERVIEYY